MTSIVVKNTTTLNARTCHVLDFGLHMSISNGMRVGHKKGEKMSEMECSTCEHLVDQFGNYVMCKLLRRFVDYEYWNGECPDDCPLERARRKDVKIN